MTSPTWLVGGAAFVVAIVAAGCSSTGEFPQRPRAALAEAWRAVDGHWARGAETSRGVTDRLAAACGDPRRMVGVALAPSGTSAVSSVRQQVLDDPVDSYLRIAVVRYSDEAAARRAVAAVTQEALDRCVVRVVNDYQEAVNERSGGTTEPSAFLATSTRADRPRANAAIVQATFDDEIAGIGSDNSHRVIWGARSSGAFLVTIVSATGAQGYDFPGWTFPDSQWVAHALDQVDGAISRAR